MILGGAQENTLLTCRGQHRDGHEVTLITGPALGPEGELISAAENNGFRTIIIDELQREIAPRIDAEAAKKLDKILRELKPDIVHTHSSKAGILGRKVAAKIGTSKIVHTIHGLAYHKYNSWWRNKLYIALEKRAALRSDAIISVADAMTIQALAAGVGKPCQYTTVYSGMEVEPYLQRSPEADAFRDSLNLPDGAILVTQVSRLAELKGHEFIIAAAEKIRDPRIIFCLVGDGHWRGRIEKDIRKRGLTERFRLTGLLPPSQIPTVMHATDVLVHCSLREGLARTLPQAMLAGKPVISFDIDGAREVVDASTGILLPPKDTAGLVEGITLLADHPQLRDELGTAGRQRCKTQFDWRTMVSQIQNVYEKILE
jgi:glycosyltransferase involved in cell wall biosynthesis